MPDEQFDDLPDEGQGVPKPQDAPEPEDTEEARKKREEDLRNIKRAEKREDARIKEAKAALEKKRAEAKALKKTLKEEDEEDTELEDSGEPIGGQEDMARAAEIAVAKKLAEEKQKEYETALETEIRKIARTKQEAQVVFAEAKKSQTTGDPALDVRLAAQRAEAIRARNRGFISPAISGAGSFSDLEINPNRNEEIPGFSPERIKWFESMGITKEDIKKYKDGPDFGRVFPKVVVNNRPY